MLQGGPWQEISFWPYILFPIAFHAILYTLFRFNQALEQQGIETIEIYHGPVGKIFSIIFYIGANLFSLASSIYFLYVMGWVYLLGMPITALAMFPAHMLGIIPLAQYILPFLCIILGLMQLVLFGFIDIEAIRIINVWVLEHV